MDRLEVGQSPTAHKLLELRLRGSAELSLFPAVPAPNGEEIVSGDGDLRLWRGWLERGRADVLLADIRAATTWRQEQRQMYDRYVNVPREQAWFGDAPPATEPFTAELGALRRTLETFVEVPFDYVLLNRYRDGRDSVAWHNDRAIPGLATPVIASLTLGATRAFELRAKAARGRLVCVDLEHGDLVVMRGEAQRNYEHRVRKDVRIAGERINLTFRQAAR